MEQSFGNFDKFGFKLRKVIYNKKKIRFLELWKF